jgi:hypothetical protein
MTCSCISILITSLNQRPKQKQKSYEDDYMYQRIISAWEDCSFEEEKKTSVLVSSLISPQQF